TEDLVALGACPRQLMQAFAQPDLVFPVLDRANVVAARLADQSPTLLGENSTTARTSLRQKPRQALRKKTGAGRVRALIKPVKELVVEVFGLIARIGKLAPARSWFNLHALVSALLAHLWGRAAGAARRTVDPTLATAFAR